MIPIADGSPLALARTAEKRNQGAVLMCRPDHYGLLYEINPWMRTFDQPDKALARHQWERLHRILSRELHLQTLLIDQQANCPDMVFTANAGLVVGSDVLLSRFRYPQRRLEEAWFSEWFQTRGFRVTVPPADLWFEGEGDALIAGSSILAGYMRRSDIGAHEWISQVLDRPVVSLELIDKRFYHLDTCLSVLAPNLLMYYPSAFDSYGVCVLNEMYETIPVIEDEALRFACNAVVVGRSVVLPAGCPILTEALEQRGYTVFSTPMTEFIRAGGAAKCLTLFLNNR